MDCAPATGDAPAGMCGCGVQPAGSCPGCPSTGRGSLARWVPDARTPSRRRRGASGRRPAAPGSASGNSHEIAAHGVHEIGAGAVHVGQESIDHRHRDVGPAGTQIRAPARAQARLCTAALHVVLVGEIRHLRAEAARLGRHGGDDAVAGPLQQVPGSAKSWCRRSKRNWSRTMPGRSSSTRAARSAGSRSCRG